MKTGERTVVWVYNKHQDFWLNCHLTLSAKYMYASTMIPKFKYCSKQTN